ncbi:MULTISPECIES: sulfur carrier protein ThiS [Providencia]|uniref:sulfur carrier protein ThiS n=1 Tax=Providencia TaxID=586 RepID=UPI0005B352D8|nr:MULTISPECIES: sulfur carrier protein ThiS [Providencia]ELR5140377.1 sulfur carrier protein ThiS [Providencia rettgeri]ELR5170522.1 sulfur carrier protein ThiS [Providencia rettgeri]QLQ94127.1 sulfur carrier protein ThiS [Providencia rettgeri]WEB84708.1 sulfur carrier protein ThiS [Providencia rettgeri]HCH7937965.1 sulfur carrier protein ThiS [Providencia rettgeri]
MHIIINDQPMDFDAPLTVNQLFAALQRQTTGTALAINQVIIPKSQWDSHVINDQDNILLFQAIAGG